MVVLGRLLSWIGDFLTARTMRVAVSGSCSCEVSVESGVPQGSVLGPLLFVLYVNYLPNYVLSKCQFFADDLKIYLASGGAFFRRSRIGALIRRLH